MSNAVTIHTWCSAHDLRAVQIIGHYVKLDRTGRGCCPFGEHHSDGKDSHPSFRVYHPEQPGGSCWYCYAWNKGGTLFDFFCLWHNIDAKTLWQRILMGEVF